MKAAKRDALLELARLVPFEPTFVERMSRAAVLVERLLHPLWSAAAVYRRIAPRAWTLDSARMFSSAGAPRGAIPRTLRAVARRPRVASPARGETLLSLVAPIDDHTAVRVLLGGRRPFSSADARRLLLAAPDLVRCSAGVFAREARPTLGAPPAGLIAIDGRGALEALDATSRTFIGRALGGEAAVRRAVRTKLERIRATDGAWLCATRMDLAGAGARTLVRIELALPGTRAFLEAQAASASLSARELEVAALAIDGRGNREIARDLGISSMTVKVHLGHIYAKAHVAGRTELAAFLLEGTRLSVAGRRRPAPA